MQSPWLLALIAGLAVLATTTASRRVRGPLAGILAAAPITPTVSCLLVGEGAGGLLADGLASVTLTVAAVATWFAWRTGLRLAVPGVVAVALIAWPLWSSPWALVAASLLLAAFATRIGALMPRQRSAGRGLPAWSRFAIGAGAILAVAVLRDAWPLAAAWLAMAPWLFVAGTVAAWLDGGKGAATQILHGGMAGAVGVIAFAVTVAWSPLPLAASLVLGWGAFAATSAAWSGVGRMAVPGRGLAAPA